MMATGPRRFTASAPRWRRMGLAFGLAIAVWLGILVVALTVGGLLLDREAARSAAGGVILLTVLSYGGFLVYALKPQPLLVDVWPDRLVLDEGRRGVFPASSARLGVWQLPMYGVAAGTALHLHDGPQRFCLGGRDHRPHPSLRLDATPVENVDAYVAAAELDAILASLPSHGPHAPHALAASPVPAVVRCMLTPNRGSMKGGLSTALPWFVAMGVASVLGVVAGALDAPSSPVAMTVLMVVIALVLGASLVGTVVRSMRRPTPALVVQLEAEGLRVLDAKTGASVTAARYVHVQGLPAQHTYSGRTSYTMPMLVLLVPGAKVITLGIPDFRYSWLGDVRKEGAAEYVVGGADWLTLVERFGVRPRLKVGEG